MIHNGVEYRRSTQGDCEYCDLKETCDEEDSGTILKACITVDEIGRAHV